MLIFSPSARLVCLEATLKSVQDEENQKGSIVILLCMYIFTSKRKTHMDIIAEGANC